MFKNDKLSTVAAVSESQNSEIEMVSWQVRLTDQVRYHQHSSSVFKTECAACTPRLKIEKLSKS